MARWREENNFKRKVQGGKWFIMLGEKQRGGKQNLSSVNVRAILCHVMVKEEEGHSYNEWEGCLLSKKEKEITQTTLAESEKVWGGGAVKG